MSSSSVTSSAPRRWTSISLWAVRGLLALAFAAAGTAKLYGVPMLVEEFEHIGLGQWFRYLTGTLEILGAVLIIIPSTVAFGAALLCCIMIGAIFTHVFVIGGSPIPAIVLLALSVIVAYAKRSMILR
ncbi:DoxX family protein [Tardiphaga sp. 20_F10_N6_6]|jgi:putative oxidoreductase|uniref:DoxX family protein n=1 Tax=Tardiphaga robiniae TaxID=943830 RepID=A0A7G6U5T8_9BRAD|nr:MULTISPECIES: DoxX family protein [Tardiphaga]MDR6657523.1 putative membrane protein YphA (DoxX/SURF4 family) [Tardiphaga robiniae]QND74370.1 DoxX family protein [Tardiphaga robiniae]UFS74807.1 DoxX family protein [Tardiphaga sp. 37S4]